MEKFFKNNLTRSLSLFIGFCLANLLIFILFVILVGTSINNTVYNQKVSLSEIESALSDESLREEVQKRTLDTDTFYFVIDNEGDITESFNVPESLIHSYSRAEIASFSRWYLNDYPVNTLIMDSGNILVQGFPEGSTVKYALTMPIEMAVQEIVFYPLILIINFILFIWLLYREQKKTKNELIPVFEGINELAEGKDIRLETKGKLGMLKNSLNLLSEKLQKKEKMRREWISEVSHDIRTPLAVIMTSSDLIKRTPENTEFVSRIQNNAIKIRALIETLNLENKVNYGSFPLNKERIRLSELLRESIINFINENSTEDYPINLDVSPQAENIMAWIDKTLFNRVIANLLTNVVIHNRKDTEIIIELSTQHDNLVLEFKNKKSPFNQKTDLNEHGIGMQFVRKFSEFHNWKFENLDTDIYYIKFIIPAE